MNDVFKLLFRLGEYINLTHGGGSFNKDGRQITWYQTKAVYRLEDVLQYWNILRQKNEYDFLTGYPQNEHYRLRRPKECFCINPLQEARKLQNVTAFRNFLIEFDSIPIREQRAAVADLPSAAEIFSGGKSVHTLVALESPVTEAEWRALADRLCKVFPKADREALRDPTHGARCPFAVRESTGEVQAVLSVGKQVSSGELSAWLTGKGAPPAAAKKEKPEIRYNRVIPPEEAVKFLPDYLRGCYVVLSRMPGNRNATCYQIACEFAKMGVPQEAALKLLLVSKLDEGELLSTVESAYRRKI